MRFPILPIIFLALPFLEIAGFVVVGSHIGVLATLALVIASGLAGAALLRFQGFAVVSRVRKELEEGRDPGAALANGAMVIVAGVLLLIPGFVTDIVGLLLLVPAMRNIAWRFVQSRVVVSAAGYDGSGRPRTGFSARRDARRDKTIDLDEDEYSSGPRSDSPWRPIDRR